MAHHMLSEILGAMAPKQAISPSPADQQNRTRIAAALAPADIRLVAGPLLGTIAADIARESSISPYAVLASLLGLVSAALGPFVKVHVSPLHDWSAASRLWSFILAGDPSSLPLPWH